MKHLKGYLLASFLAITVGSANAGPILIAGTDSDDHGSASGGINLNGWKFLQLGIGSIGGAVTNGQKTRSASVATGRAQAQRLPARSVSQV